MLRRRRCPQLRGQRRLLREGPFTDIWVHAGGRRCRRSAIGVGLGSGTASQSGRAAPGPAGPDVMGGPSGLVVGNLMRGGNGQMTRRHPHDRHTAAGLCEVVKRRPWPTVGSSGGSRDGWSQPRALGHRSILADPLGRCTARPKPAGQGPRVVPAVRPGGRYWPNGRASGSRWIVLRPTCSSPTTCRSAQRIGTPFAAANSGELELATETRSTIPACTHIDWSARVQTVDAGTDPLFHRLIAAFDDLGNSVAQCSSTPRSTWLENRSSCTPAEAFGHLLDALQLDLLVIEDCVVDLRGWSSATGSPAADTCGRAIGCPRPLEPLAGRSAEPAGGGRDAWLS